MIGRKPQLSSGGGGRGPQRQGKMTEKTLYQFLITNDNFDFVLQLAEAEEISMAAMLNRIISEKRRSVPQRTFVPS